MYLGYFIDGPQICRSTTLGQEYTGTVAVTRTGKTCQAWLLQTPHSHSYTDPVTFPDANLIDANNFCRNPNSSPGGPWCFTTDSSTRWEYCDVQFCQPTLGRILHRQMVDFGGSISRKRSSCKFTNL